MYQKRKSEVREGKFFPEKVKPQGPVLFAEVAQDFLGYSKKFKRSHDHDESRMETLLRLWRACALTELTPGRIERDLSDRGQQEEWTAATYNRYRTLASGVFSLDIRNEKAPFNPVRGTRHRTENNTRVRYLTEEEEGRLLDTVRSEFQEREGEIIVALFSGMRRSEQYVTPDCRDGGLKWAHLDFFTEVITVPRSKHGESRHIPMSTLLRDTLVLLKRDSQSEYVFPGTPPEGWFRKLCRKAGVSNFTWHCFAAYIRQSVSHGRG